MNEKQVKAEIGFILLESEVSGKECIDELYNLFQKAIDQGRKE